MAFVLIIVEFIGLPGVGKTTTCKYLSGFLQSQGVNSIYYENLFGHFRHAFIAYGEYLKSILLNPIFSTKYTLHALKYTFSLNIDKNQIKTYRQALSSSFLYFDGKRTIEKNKMDVYLISQWLIQYIWSIGVFLDNPYKNDLFILLDDAMKIMPRNYVICLAPPSVVIKRINARKDGRSRFDYLSDSQLSEIVVKADSFTRCIADHIMKSGANTLLLDTTKPIAENIKEFTKILNLDGKNHAG